MKEWRKTIINKVDRESIVKRHGQFLTGEVKKLYGFWDVEVAVFLTRHYFFNVAKWTREDLCNKFIKKDFVEKYGLLGAVKCLRSSTDLIIASFPEFNIKRWEMNVPIKSSYWDVETNRAEVLHWFVEQLLKDNVIDSIDDIPQVINQKLFIKYGIKYSFLRKYFNGCCYEAINYIYKGRFNKWEFKSDRTLSRDEIKYAIRWIFKEQLKITVSEIPKFASKKLFEDYRIMNWIVYHFGSYKEAIIATYPNEFHSWSFQQMKSGSWKSKKSRVNLLKELIDEVLGIELKDIPKFINAEFLSEDFGKFVSACNQYYNCNYFNWVNDCYPNLFTEDEYEGIVHRNRRSKGFDSIGEHKIFTRIKEELGMKIIDCGRSNTYKLHNSEENENYIPDFIIEDNIICEFYGLYHENPNRDFLVDYKEKTHRKNKFYKKYCEDNDMLFLDLYPKDIRGKSKGMKEKISILMKNNKVLEVV